MVISFECDYPGHFKLFIQLMKSSRDHTKKSIPDSEGNCSENNHGPSIENKQPIKNYLLSKKGCEVNLE